MAACQHGNNLTIHNEAIENIAMLIIRAFETEDESDVIALWSKCNLTRSHNNPKKDIQRKLKVRGDLFRVGLCNGRIVATIMVGYEGHRGWINYLAVDPEYQRRGFGRQMMEEAERILTAEGCPKINLQVRQTNAEVLAFYRAIGYAVDDVVSLGKRLEHDN